MPAPARGLPWQPSSGRGRPPRAPGRAGRVHRRSRAQREPQGAGAAVAPQSSRGLEILVRGSPAAAALERPLLGLWPSRPVISDLGAPGRVLGRAGGSLGSPRAAIFSRRGGREGTIYRSNNPRSLRQWNPACVTRADIPGPLSPRPLGLPVPRLPLAASRRNRAAPRALVWPKLAGPRASVAPPPLPVRHGALKRRVGLGRGAPVAEAAELGGLCSTGGTHAGPDCDSGCRSRAGGAGAGQVGAPRGGGACITAALSALVFRGVA